MSGRSPGGWRALVVPLGGLVLVWADPVYRAVFLVNLFSAVIIGALGPVTILWAVGDLGLTESQAIFIVVVYALAFAISGPVGGYLTDRWGRRKPLVVVGMVALPLRTLSFALLTDYRLILISSFVISLIPGGNLYAVLADHFAAQEQRGHLVPRNTINAAVRLAFPLGVAAGAPLGTFLYEIGGGRLVWLTLTVLGGLTLLYALVALPDTRPPRLLTHTPTAQPPRAGWTGLVTGTSRTVLLFVAALTLFYAAAMVSQILVPLHVTRYLQASPALVGPLYTVNSLVGLVSLPLAGYLADRLGDRPVVLASFLLLALSWALFLVGTSLVALVVAMAVAALAGSANSVAITIAQRLDPARVGLLTALTTTAFWIGRSGGNVVIGLLIDWLGLPRIYWVPILEALIGFGLMLGVTVPATRPTAPAITSSLPRR